VPNDGINPRLKFEQSRTVIVNNYTDVKTALTRVFISREFSS